MTELLFWYFTKFRFVLSYIIIFLNNDWSLVEKQRLENCFTHNVKCK